MVDSDPIIITATWQVPITYEAKTTTFTTTVGELLAAQGAPELQKGKAIVGYAEALKDGSHDVPRAAHDAAVAANTTGTDLELTEVALLLTKHPAY